MLVFYETDAQNIRECVYSIRRMRKNTIAIEGQKQSKLSPGGAANEPLYARVQKQISNTIENAN